MLTRTAYWVSQNARIAWFFGEYMLGRYAVVPSDLRGRRHSGGRAQRMARQLAGDVREITGLGRRGTLTLKMLLDDIRALQRRDWENVRDGIYGLPDDWMTPPTTWLSDAIDYFRELPEVVARRRRDGWNEVTRHPDADRYPDYFRRNFHYQTDGYLSPTSARLYDHQVEVLFMGSADMMRRQALVPLIEKLGGGWTADTVLVDVATGTGRFLEMVKAERPRLPAIALDLAPPYLDVAQRRLRRFPHVQCIQGLAETLPLPDAAADIITCVYLLHEVPADVRRAIAAEFARVLKPGGRAIIVESVQLGDVPAFDPMLRGFPSSFHEPYYPGWIAEDTDAVFADSGLTPVSQTRAFLSKVMVYDRR